MSGVTRRTKPHAIEPMVAALQKKDSFKWLTFLSIMSDTHQALTISCFNHQFQEKPLSKEAAAIRFVGLLLEHSEARHWTALGYMILDSKGDALDQDARDEVSQALGILVFVLSALPEAYQQHFFKTIFDMIKTSPTPAAQVYDSSSIIVALSEHFKKSAKKKFAGIIEEALVSREETRPATRDQDVVDRASLSSTLSPVPAISSTPLLDAAKTDVRRPEKHVRWADQPNGPHSEA